MNKYSNILIAGAGEAGRMLLREYAKRRKAHLIAGFVDDDPAKRDVDIEGKRIIGTTSEIADVIGRHSIGQVVIAMPSVHAAVINGIVTSVFSCDPSVNIHILPEVEKFFDTVPLLPALQNLPFAELFGREEYSIDIDSIKGRFAGETVLVTGAGGSIGSEICRQLLKFDVKRIVAVGRGEHSIYTLAKDLSEYLALMDSKPEIICKIIDVKDIDLLGKCFDEYRPGIVFHAAAHKHVPLMEFNETEAIKNNVAGTKNVLDLSMRYGVKRFVLISTDKAVRPVNIMGATKRLAELVTDYYHREKGLRTSIVRFGNVIGSRGSVIPLFREQIERGGPVTVTHPDVKRYFMSIPEASLLVINAAAYSSGGEIFVLDMGKQYRIIDVARRIIELYGLVPEVDIPIEITGLRPGEKLYEELFYDRAHLSNTPNEKIFVLRDEASSLDNRAIEESIGSGFSRLLSCGRAEFREELKKLVPEYRYEERTDESIPLFKLVN